jgi:hypothetical protein
MFIILILMVLLKFWWRTQAERSAEYLPAKDAEHVFCPARGGRILRHRQKEAKMLILKYFLTNRSFFRQSINKIPDDEKLRQKNKS